MEQDSLPPPFSSATDAPPPSHPSYAEMITAAIIWDSSQGKQGGSSKRAIAKYIDRVYTDLPPSHSSLLTQYLKELKNSGHLTMVKNSYQLASAAAAANPELLHTGSPPNPTPKRAGRPSKPKPKSDQAQAQAQDNGVQTGKKRGRPPKQQVIRPHQVEHQIIMEPAEVPFVQPISQVEPNFGDGLEAHKRRPGRPPKLTPVVPFASLAQQPNPVDAPLQETVEGKRRPGRPSKSNVGGPVAGTGRSRGRPKKSGLGPGMGPVSRPVGKRPRGRPPKMSGGVMLTGKRRGRPPKGSGPPKPRKLSGKRVGRPKKDAANFKQASEQIVNEELTRKLDFIHSKIRDAVDVIRPYIPHEDAPLMALQQLEELVTPNVTAPPVMATPMTVIAPVPVSAAANITAPPTGTVTAPSTETVTAFMNAPAPFSVNLPPMTVGAPFQVPSSFDNQQRMSWMPEAQS